MNTFWTERRILELRLRWEADESGGEIGKALGCSRSAVLGKLSRLGLLTAAPADRQGKNWAKRIRREMTRINVDPARRQSA